MRKANWRISRCCTGFVVPLEKRRVRRINGLRLPLHPQQVVGWIAIFGIAVGTFTVVIPYLEPSYRSLAFGLIGGTFSLHVVSHLVALLLDPADVRVRERSTNKIVPEFDRAKHRHVIENGRCHLCNISTTNKRTKHCSICNKCITQFDHHCKWLNNCVGGRNYVAFIVCVVSAVISALGVIGISATEIFVFGSLNNTNMDNGTLPITQTPGTGSLVVISLVGILSAIAAVLLIHLCFFHGYIAYLGLTTYEYVRNKRERKMAKAARAEGVTEESKNAGNANTVSVHSTCSSFLCNADGKNPSNNLQRLRYNQSENDYPDQEDEPSRERNVYICSTHQRESCDDGGRKDRRNFHLYFSYETRDSETSIEVSSQTILNDVETRPESIEFKPSTPSPVSCCFSIINSKSTSLQSEKRGGKLQKDGQSDKERGARTCLTMRRIQSFLRTRLRRNSRQRSLNGEASRSRKNKVNPSTISNGASKETELAAKSPITSTSKDDKLQTRPPLKLPPLVLPPRHKMKQISDFQNLNTVPVPILPTKRSQPPLRIRRTSFYKRPRFKMGPHVTEIAQLSPIPESEFSKPASPRTPPQVNHFPFPPPVSNDDNKSNDAK